MEKRKLKEKLQFLQDIINSFFVLRAKGEQLKNSRDLAKNSKTCNSAILNDYPRSSENFSKSKQT